MKLLIATRNRNKIIEIKAYLKTMKIEIMGLEDFPDAPEIIEDGKTFEENAAKKAVENARHSGLITLADDSGLMVDVLGGKPGVYSARYAGENATDIENNEKLLAKLEGVDYNRRTAAFVCCVAIANPEKLIRVVTGKCEGRIGLEPRGREGFGYDPIFIKEDYNKTFAELSLDVKNRISHRAVALQKASIALESYLLSLDGRIQ